MGNFTPGWQFKNLTIKKKLFYTFLLCTLFFLITLSCETPQLPDVDACIANPNPDQVCTEQYEPVCGCDDVTYSNSCYADAAGVSVWTVGECAG